MKLLQTTQNRLAAARNNEGGFTLAESLVAIGLIAILIVICLNTMGTVFPTIVKPMLSNAENVDLKPAQQAAQRIYKDIQAFKDANPDTTVTKTALVNGGYVNEPDVVWAFHTSSDPASPQTCVIAYITSDTTTDYTQDHPASYGSSYQSNTLWQNCQPYTCSNNTLVPNWDSV